MNNRPLKNMTDFLESHGDKPGSLALASGSACLVCGSTLTLRIIRVPALDLLHCNHCGSEVPRHIPQCDRQGDRLRDGLARVAGVWNSQAEACADNNFVAERMAEIAREALSPNIARQTDGGDTTSTNK
jgi:hypothetical protein